MLAHRRRGAASTAPLDLVPSSRESARHIVLDALAAAGPLLFAASNAADSDRPQDGLRALRALRDRLTLLLPP